MFDERRVILFYAPDFCFNYEVLYAEPVIGIV